MSSDPDRGSTRRISRDGIIYHVVEIPCLRLRAVRGPQAGRTWKISSHEVSIGGDPAQSVSLIDDAVSRHHAILHLEPDGIRVRDAGSKNGTWVRGLRISEALVLDGEEVVIGETALRLELGTRKIQAPAHDADRLGELSGSSSAMREIFGLLRAVSRTHAGILILGESGTGKELTARTIHLESGRPGPFVTFDCASTEANLIRSELFGHMAGAYTGATGSRLGAFRSAEGGTLFIDEIGELPLELQPLLLRVLERREVQPLGSDKVLPVNVRLVAATHRDLESLVAEGKFREDLYHRLAVVPLRLPPLRERPSDIPLLIERLRESLDYDFRLHPSALHVLQTHPWPGNVRALRNAIERIGVFFPGKEVRDSDLEIILRPPRKRENLDTLELRELERQAMREALRRTGGRRDQAAELLGISTATLRRKVREMENEGSTVIPEEKESGQEP